jgi:hypothetical protein
MKEGKEVKIPSFVKVLREVTSDNSYASSTMAADNYKMPEEDLKEIKATLLKEKENIMKEKKAAKELNSKKEGA